MLTNALNNLRVLDFTRLLPGPYATHMLCAMGAEVIKVEDPVQGDYLRYFPPLVDGTSTMFAALNRGKKSIAVNLKSPEGQILIQNLVKTADIVIESFRPGVLSQFGLSGQDCLSINPKLIYCSLTGFGQQSPISHLAGHDLNYIGLAGLLAISGQNPDHTPQFPGGQIADIGGAFAAIVQILAAINQRERTHQGTILDVSLTESVLPFVSMILPTVSDFSINSKPGEMMLNGQYVCYNVYKTKDQKWVTLAALEQKFWTRFCAAIQREDLINHAYDKADNGQMAYTELTTIFSSKTRDEWTELNNKYDFCCFPIHGPDELKDQWALKQLSIAESGQIEHQFITAELNDTPQLGAHTLDVLKPLIDDQALDSQILKNQGVIDF